jgi:hypothetical protein
MYYPLHGSFSSLHLFLCSSVDLNGAANQADCTAQALAVGAHRLQPWPVPGALTFDSERAILVPVSDATCAADRALHQTAVGPIEATLPASVSAAAPAPASDAAPRVEPRASAAAPPLPAVSELTPVHGVSHPPALDQPMVEPDAEQQTPAVADEARVAAGNTPVQALATPSVRPAEGMGAEAGEQSSGQNGPAHALSTADSSAEAMQDRVKDDTDLPLNAVMCDHASGFGAAAAAAVTAGDPTVLDNPEQAGAVAAPADAAAPLGSSPGSHLAGSSSSRLPISARTFAVLQGGATVWCEMLAAGVQHNSSAGRSQSADTADHAEVQEAMRFLLQSQQVLAELLRPSLGGSGLLCRGEAWAADTLPPVDLASMIRTSSAGESVFLSLPALNSFLLTQRQVCHICVPWRAVLRLMSATLAEPVWRVHVTPC